VLIEANFAVSDNDLAVPFRRAILAFACSYQTQYIVLENSLKHNM